MTNSNGLERKHSWLTLNAFLRHIGEKLWEISQASRHRVRIRPGTHEHEYSASAMLCRRITMKSPTKWLVSTDADRYVATECCNIPANFPRQITWFPTKGPVERAIFNIFADSYRWWKWMSAAAVLYHAVCSSFTICTMTWILNAWKDGNTWKHWG